MNYFKDFFSTINTVYDIPKDNQEFNLNYLEAIKAFARTTYSSIYLIDYQIGGFEFISDNPLFLCGHTAEEVKMMGYSFYYKYVLKSDLDLLIKINTVGFEFFETLPLDERKDYTITYDFHIKNQENNIILINQKLTPIFLTDSGKIWKAVCIVSLSTEKQAGNIKIFKKGSNKIFVYDLDNNLFKTDEKIVLSPREKEILQLSIRGYNINEIAKALFVSPDTVKFHRKKLFNKIDVNNISEAIMFVTNNKLI